MKKEHFLKEDFETACIEESCIRTCIYIAEKASKAGDYKKAESLLIDASKSMKELGRLHNKKVNDDKLNELIEHMSKVDLTALLLKGED